MALEEYRRKRKFAQTPEPAGEKTEEAGGLRFVVQKHHATRLHYDFRLEMAGALKSWAVPKGPTLDPAEKRLAMMVEDHPLDYMHFEGIIPAGNYGAGTVMVWDTGTYQLLGHTDPLKPLEKGDLKFLLRGSKLKGEFALVRMRSRRPGSKGNEWLLLKKKDAHTHAGWNADHYDWSVLTGRSLEEIARDVGQSVGEARAGQQPQKAVWSAAPESDDLRRKVAQAARRTLEKTRRDAEETGAVDPAALTGAVKAEMPNTVRPMLATPVEQPQDSADWLFEIKWDGVRAVAFLENGRLRLQSRNLRDITLHYPELTEIARHFRARRAILDGEIVTLDAEGRSSFERLQQRMNAIPDARLVQQFPVLYYAFDLLYLEGYDLRRVPLEQRKEALRRILLPSGEARVRFSDHHIGEGRALLEAACQKGLEGIVGKRRQSLYLEARSPDWQKAKATQVLECVVGGYTEPRRSRKYFGALVLGVYREGKLVHVGNAGSGFTQASQKEAWELLKPLRTDRNPFAGEPATLERPHWVRPELMARIKFTEWTSEGLMRAPVVLEVRRAHDARDSSQPAPAVGAGFKPAPTIGDTRDSSIAAPGAEEEPPALFSGSGDTQMVRVDGRAMKIQNLGKVFFPEDGYTKRDVIEFYDRIAGYLLPHMHDRPVVMKRYPNGIHKPFFFQKEAGEAMRAWIRTVRIESEAGSADFTNFVLCNDRATLVYLANLGCIEQNLWMSRVGSLENPDFVLLDLDPGEDAPFDIVIEAAQALKAKFDLLGLAGYPKTSGSRGMHIYVPLATEYTYDHSRQLADLLSLLVDKEAPGLLTRERSLRRRPKNRVYLDFLQNGHGKTVPPPYSLRPRPGAPVSTPLRWEEVRPGLDPRQFHMHSIWQRLAAHGDLFAETLEKGQRLEPALDRLQQTLAGTGSAKQKKGAL